MRIGILTGGGDAPGLNAAIRGAARRAFQLGHKVSGIKNGWAGTLSGEISDLSPTDVRGILPLGGTILGTSRTNPMKEPDGLGRVLENLRSRQVDGLVAIGGDDTLSVARTLADAGLRVVGVPKTIDNDLSGTEFCIGFDTAVGIVTEALDRLHTTASAHHRVIVVEVMGRHTGWVGLAGGLAGGADLIVIPEFRISLAEIVRHLNQRRASGKDFSIIVVAEGVDLPELEIEENGETTDQFGHAQLLRRGLGDALSRLIERETGFETRATVLGHTQRGGTPTAADRLWATRLGVAATDLLHGGQSGVAPVVRGGDVAVAPLADLVAEQRRVPKELYELTYVFG